MVWKETCAVDEPMRFVMAIEAGEESFAATCRRFSVSRRVGYKWFARYRLDGVSGLSDRSRAPHRRVRSLCGGDCGRVPVGSAGASELGSGEGAGLAAASRSGRWLAGGEHDRGLVRSRGFDGEAPVAPARAAAHGAVCRVRCGQRRVVHRFQGLVPDRRRGAVRALDPVGCAQPLPSALPGGGARRYRPCLADPGRRLARAWPARGAALGQRAAVRLDRRRRPVAVFGSGDQGRRAARAHRAGKAAAERPP